MDRKVDMKDYIYDLPEEKIATFPLAERDRSKLLVCKNGDISEDIFRSLENYLPADSLLVRNNTRVIRARLLFQTDSGSPIEIFILEPHGQSIEQALQQMASPIVFQCLVGNKRKWKQDILKLNHRLDSKDIVMEAKLSGEAEDAILVEFRWSDDNISFGKLLEEFGRIPLPPYIKRGTVEADTSTYQTTYSKVDGSVAAPTAGLHFTTEMQERLTTKGIEVADVTLHVGAGTFKPVKALEASEHIMHAEEIIVSKAFIEKLLDALQKKKKIIALGTTSLRTLETLYGLGAQPHLSRSTGGQLGPGGLGIVADREELSLSQWEIYKVENISAVDAIQSLLDYMQSLKLENIHARTQLMIVPGFEFRVADALITNFHQPGSTLLMLVAAFIGEDWKRVYDYALNHHFRFLSYGDGSLLFKNSPLTPPAF